MVLKRALEQNTSLAPIFLPREGALHLLPQQRSVVESGYAACEKLTDLRNRTRCWLAGSLAGRMDGWIREERRETEMDREKEGDMVGRMDGTTHGI